MSNELHHHATLLRKYADSETPIQVFNFAGRVLARALDAGAIGGIEAIEAREAISSAVDRGGDNAYSVALVQALAILSIHVDGFSGMAPLNLSGVANDNAVRHDLRRLADLIESTTANEATNGEAEQTSEQHIDESRQQDSSGSAARMGKEAQALAVLAEHPDWTNKQIAKAVGVHDKTLSTKRWATFRGARAAQESAKHERPAAHHDRRTGEAQAEATAKCRHGCREDVQPWTCGQCDTRITDACRECHAEVAHGG